jgi:spore maturation protein CgeB
MSDVDLLSLKAHGTNIGSKTPRVLVIGSQSFPDTLEWHVMDSLRYLQCPHELFDVRIRLGGYRSLLSGAANKLANTFLREPERLSENALLRKVAAFQPELVLVILGNQLSPKTVARLRSVTSAPLVCWCQDQMTTLGRQYLLGSGYDAVFVKDRYMQDLFSRMIKSTQFYYLPEACNLRVHRTVQLDAKERERLQCDVMIAASLYYYRQEILQQLGEFDLKVWGYRPDWLVYRLQARHGGGEIVLQEKAKAMQAARICLNTLHYAEVNGLNCRAFEIAGCGGFQLVSAVPVLAEHFQPGSEVASFDSVEDLLEQIRHYLRHPDAAAAIAARGQARAHAEHTYEHRLEEIFRICLWGSGSAQQVGKTDARAAGGDRSNFGRASGARILTAGGS